MLIKNPYVLSKKLKSYSDGLVDTHFGNQELAPKTAQVSIFKLLIEDLSVEEQEILLQIDEIELEFSDYEIEVYSGDQDLMVNVNDKFKISLGKRSLSENGSVELDFTAEPLILEGLC